MCSTTFIKVILFFFLPLISNKMTFWSDINSFTLRFPCKTGKHGTLSYYIHFKSEKTFKLFSQIWRLLILVDGRTQISIDLISNIYAESVFTQNGVKIFWDANKLYVKNEMEFHTDAISSTKITLYMF